MLLKVKSKTGGHYIDKLGAMSWYRATARAYTGGAIWVQFAFWCWFNRQNVLCGVMAVTHRVERSALVNYSQQQMFELVNDIEAYPQFMDGCVGAKILARGDNWLEARLELSKAGVSQSFVTRNQLQAPHSMIMSLVDGPFKFLRGAWRFTALGEHACKVTFELEFELQNRLLGMAVGKLFESVSNKQVDALCARAKQVYK